MRVLVTGGAGYIGSHTVLHLAAAGHEVTIADNFANSKPAVVPRLERLVGAPVPVCRVDLTDEPATDRLLAGGFDAVVHFAGLKAVGESVEHPVEYYRVNLGATTSLLRAMAKHGCRLLVFSSSATVYGTHAPTPYREEYEPLESTSPYGQTKVMIERILLDATTADPRLRVGSLRYFNPVGAHPSGQIGEDPMGVPNNLMPFIAQVAVGRRPELQVFGSDYPTADGTCERDYIHVEDLAAGHVAALHHVAAAEAGTVDVPRWRAWNLGTGRGTSVVQMIDAFRRASGREIPYRVAGRRPGDLAAFWADAGRAQRELGWRATLGIDRMCADTWRWQRNNPTGYPS